MSKRLVWLVLSSLAVLQVHLQACLLYCHFVFPACWGRSNAVKFWPNNFCSVTLLFTGRNKNRDCCGAIDYSKDAPFWVSLDLISYSLTSSVSCVPFLGTGPKEFKFWVFFFLFVLELHLGSWCAIMEGSVLIWTNWRSLKCTEILTHRKCRTYFLLLFPLYAVNNREGSRKSESQFFKPYGRIVSGWMSM